MVDDTKNFRSKIFAYKGLGFIGSADIIGAAITGFFWLSIASFVAVEEYGHLHYFLGIAGIAYIVTLLGTQQTITVYSAKKINVVSTLIFISIVVVTITALIIFFMYDKPELSLLVIGYAVNDMAIGYLLGK